VSTITLQNTLETITCAQCGVLFAVPSNFETKRREDGGDFYCPNGHSLCFQSRIKKLEAERDALAKDLREQKCTVLRLEAGESQPGEECSPGGAPRPEWRLPALQSEFSKSAQAYALET